MEDEANDNAIINGIELEHTIMLKDLISKMQDILNKYITTDSALELSALEGEMLIVNQKNEELFLEIRFSKKKLFGKECYSFIC